jgi:cardiolipin synthase A/B
VKGGPPLLYLFGTVIILLLLILIDYVFGRLYHLKHVKKHDFPVRHSHITIFTSGPLLFEKMLADITEAKHHIHMLFYIFRNDEFGMTLLKLLEQKASEGVKVRILIDRIGSHRFPRKLMKKMSLKGVEMEYCHTPSFPFFFFHLQNRNHRKITVIDGKIGYLGGFNVGNEYMDLHKRLSPWRDCHVRFTGEGVWDLQKQFMTDWTEATWRGIELTEKELYYPDLPRGNVQHQFFAFEGDCWEDKVSEMISYAKKSVIIGSPYFIPSKKAFGAILDAIKRGVEIILIVPEMSDHLFIQEASYRFLRKLIRFNCCSVYRYRNGFYHAKIFIIDDHICSIGTANFDNRSFYFNHELNSLFKDPDMVNEMLDIAKIDLSKSTKLTANMLQHRNLSGVLKEWVAILLSPLL